MSLIALSKTEHIDLSITKNPNYGFFKNQTIIPLCGFELMAAVSEMPLFFMRTTNSFRLFGLLGLEDNQNLCVSASGSWELAFLPAALKVHPFGLGDLKNGNKTLMLPRKNDFLVKRSLGHPLLTQNGEPTELTLSYVKLLSEIQLDLGRAEKACSLLKELDLLEPFSIEVGKGSLGLGNNHFSWRLKTEETDDSVLFRIRPDGFKSIDDDKFLEMRKSGLLTLIYAHFHSLGNITKLIIKMQSHNRTVSSLKNLGEKIFNDGDTNLNLDFRDS